VTQQLSEINNAKRQTEHCLP